MNKTTPAAPTKPLQAESIMTSTVLTVNPTMTVREAIVLLTTNKISGAPVVDNMHTVLSVVSEGDLIKLAASMGMDKQISHCLEKLPQIDELITARSQTTFAEIYKLFLGRSVHRIIITDDNGKLRGIVSRSNALRVLVDAPVATK